MHIKKKKKSTFSGHISSIRSILKPYLDLLPSDGLQLGLLSDGKRVDEDFGARGDCHLKVVTVLLNLRDTLDIFAFLDELIRKT